MTESVSFRDVVDVVEGRAGDDVVDRVRLAQHQPEVRAMVDWTTDLHRAARRLPVSAPPPRLGTALLGLFERRRPCEIALRLDDVQLSAVRQSGAGDDPTIFVAESVDVLLHIEDTERGPSVWGQVLPTASSSARFSVFHGGAGAFVETDLNGTFRIDPLAPGCAHLDVVGDGVAVRLPLGGSR